MDQRIIIEIQNNVKVQSSASSSPRQNLNNNSINSNKKNKSSIVSKGKFDRLISTQFIAGTVQKVANSTGNEEARKLSSAIGHAVKYGGAVADLVSGNPVSLVAVSLELATKGIEKWCNELATKAEEQNSVDTARINAGLVDLSSINVKTNFWGRYTYNEK